MLKYFVMNDSNKLNFKTKIWIENESGQIVLGQGRIRMLETIDQTGSINAAAKAMGISYKAIWERLKLTEERLGKVLVIRKKGGAAGGASKLSDYAYQLIESFNELQKDVVKCDDQKFNRILRPVLE